jgi:hypothetical protein
MTVEELILVLQKIEDKSLTVIFTDYSLGESIVTDVTVCQARSYDDSIKTVVDLSSNVGL